MRMPASWIIDQSPADIWRRETSCGVTRLMMLYDTMTVIVEFQSHAMPDDAVEQVIRIESSKENSPPRQPDLVKFQVLIS
jgi:hypothetical protein